jgi:hypothetical protein
LVLVEQAQAQKETLLHFHQFPQLAGEMLTTTQQDRRAVLALGQLHLNQLVVMETRVVIRHRKVTTEALEPLMRLTLVAAAAVLVETEARGALDPQVAMVV